MGYSAKRLLNGSMRAMELAFNVIRGIDYQTLSQYILKINQHNDIDGILFEVSRCLKDMLDYELFGFALKSETSLDLWIDPRMHSTFFADYVAKDFNSQNIDHKLHYFDKDTITESHNSDVLDIKQTDLIQGHGRKSLRSSLFSTQKKDDASSR